MLKCKKTIEHLNSTKEEELVFKDYNDERIQKFDSEHKKLMDISDGEDLDDNYIGKEPTETI